jgi:hypothetical protein
MSNLEDVFLKINKEYAPDLFGDLSKFDASNQSITSDDKMHASIGHSTHDHTGNSQMDDLKSSNFKTAEEIEEEEIENLIRGSSCVRSCTASGAKRFIIYKRDWCGLLCQIVIPLVLVLFGLWLTSGPSKLVQSPPRPLSTGFLPYKQRILMNDRPVNMTDDGMDIMGSEIAAMLPNSTEAFEVSYKDDLNYTEFYEAVYAARNDGPAYPYRYGSYQIYKASKSMHLY